MASFKYKAAKAVALLAVILMLAALTLPWKQWLSNYLVTQLEAQGFENVYLTVASVGLEGITLEQLSIGKESPLTLSHLTLQYTLSELWYGDISGITLQGLNLLAQQQKGEWSFSGLNRTNGKDDSKSSFAIPVTAQELDAVPLHSATLKDSHLRFNTDSWNMDIPLHVTWQKSPAPRLSYQASGLQLIWQDIIVHSGDTTFDATLNTSEKQWAGNWQSKDITLQGAAREVPPLSAHGKINANEKVLAISGDLSSSDKSYHAAFRLNYNNNSKVPSQFSLQSASMPWGGGTLSLKDVAIALGAAKPIRLNLEVRDVSVDALLQMATSNKATATGTVSGTIPVSIAADGAIRFLQGSLRAKEAGTIIMAADAIPGDNQQITLVRDILKNLHYKMLSVGINSGSNNKQAILLSVEGNNPDVYEGRPVKLNVQLNGDVLNLIQQSVMPFTNPKQLLK